MKTKLLLLVAFLSVTAFLSAKSFECFVIMPPEKPLEGVKKIAVLNFRNFDNNPYYETYGGSAFVNYLTSDLLDENRGIHNLSSGFFGTEEGKTYIKSSPITTLSIIEREQLSNVLKEKNLVNDYNLEDNQAAEIGHILGIDALIMGTIKHNYNSTGGYVKLMDGSTAHKTENKCITEITMKVVSVSNGMIMATESFNSVSSDSEYGNNESNVLGFSALAENNLKILSHNVANYLTPHYKYYKADFQKIRSGEYKSKSKDIDKMIDNADFNGLYTIFKSIYDADNYNADAAHNLALLDAITGDYQGCAEWNRIAFETDGKKYKEAEDLANTWENNYNNLLLCGVEIEKIDFESNKKMEVFADKVKTKGKRDDRFEVYEAPDLTSSVVSKVPGDMEFIVLERSDGFVKIKLIGGKEGYINVQNLRR